MGAAPTQQEKTMVAVTAAVATIGAGYMIYRYNSVDKNARKIMTPRGIVNVRSVSSTSAKNGKAGHKSSQVKVPVEVALSESLQKLEDSLSKDQKVYIEFEVKRIRDLLSKLVEEGNPTDGYISKTNILELLKVIGRLGKSRTQKSRFEHQDKRSPYLESDPDTYFGYAIQGIVKEEVLYNDWMDYILMRINVEQENFFNLQSVYMNDSKFWEALTKLDMETLPIGDCGIEESKSKMMPEKECKSMLKQLYKDSEIIFDSVYRKKIESNRMEELSPVLFETIANDLMFVKNGYRMDDILRQASKLKLMNDIDFMDYIQTYQNKLLASVIQNVVQEE